MRVVDEAILKKMRLNARYCEYCKTPLQSAEIHHIRARGIGGGNRLDIPENLVALGGAFDCRCHQDAQAGVITKIELFRVAGRRLGTSGIKCRNKVARLLRRRK